MSRVRVLPALVLVACGAVQSVPPDAAAPDASSSSAADAGAPPSSKVCTVDQECNEDPTMSSLAGTCFQGVCICRANMFVQTSGRCGSKPPADCATLGGTCRQAPAACAAGELEGAEPTNRSCGDFVAAVCCLPATACRAAVDLVCCGASTTPHEPICVNGWKTCGAGGPTPAIRQNGCF